MHAHMIEEMAHAISKELPVNYQAVLHLLHRYWDDRIALTWHVKDMLQAALNMGRPITKADARLLLYNMFEECDPENGISWDTLTIELQEYRLDWTHLTEDQYDEVQGVFQVWRSGDLIAHQMGLHPNYVLGNLPKALALARSLADETPEHPILIACLPRHSGTVEPWLSVTREKEHTHIQERKT